MKGTHVLAYFGSHSDSNEKHIVDMNHESSLDASRDEQQNASTVTMVRLVMHSTSRRNKIPSSNSLTLVSSHLVGDYLYAYRKF